MKSSTTFEHPFYPDILSHFDVVADTEFHIKGTEKCTRAEFLSKYPHYETSINVLEYVGVTIVFDIDKEESKEEEEVDSNAEEQE